MATMNEGDLTAAGGCGAEQATNKPAHEKKHHLQGGYECIFVKAPPDHLQTECPICLCVLKEPYLIDCCGNSFCKTCIEPIKVEGKPCPLCNIQFTTIMPDKRLQRTLNELQVYCCHKEAGCEWVGELGSLPQHLNLNPQNDGGRLIGCQLASVECVFCCEDIQRKDLKEHEDDKCPERAYDCEYCQEYESTYIDVTTNHWPVCPSRPVPCPNECGISPKFEVLHDHMEECPLQAIDCAFKYAGCNERLPRKDMPNHITQSLAHHMSLQATSHQQELLKLNNHISELEEQLDKATQLLKQSTAKVAELHTANQRLQEKQSQSATKITELHHAKQSLQQKQNQNVAEIAELRNKSQLLQEKLDQECRSRVAAISTEIKLAQEQRLKGHLGNLRGEIKKAQNQTKQEILKHVESEIAVVHRHVGIVPFSFTMLNFEEKKSSNTSWYSPSFYTHPRGYKMCTRVYANGWGEYENSHLSVFFYMMRGEYDESLKWPFRGDITLQLLNQTDDVSHHEIIVKVNDQTLSEFCNQVTSGDLSSKGWGRSKFICHSDLLPNYLKDNCLSLCI